MNIKKKIAYLVTASEKMLELAKQGDWEKVTEIESQRRPELECLFNSLSPETSQAHSALLRQSIERILVVDNEIMTIGLDSKNKLVELIQKNSSSRQAMSEYQKNTVL